MLFFEKGKGMHSHFWFKFSISSEERLGTLYFPRNLPIWSPKFPLNPLPNNSAGHKDRPGDSLGARRSGVTAPQDQCGSEEGRRPQDGGESGVGSELQDPESLRMLCRLPGLGGAEGMSCFPSRKSRKTPALYSSEVCVNSQKASQGPCLGNRYGNTCLTGNKVWVAVSPSGVYTGHGRLWYMPHTCAWDRVDCGSCLRCILGTR